MHTSIHRETADEHISLMHTEDLVSVIPRQDRAASPR